jgi:hypothetical protein
MAGEWRLLLRYEAEAWGPFSVHSFTLLSGFICWIWTSTTMLTADHRPLRIRAPLIDQLLMDRYFSSVISGNGRREEQLVMY